MTEHRPNDPRQQRDVARWVDQLGNEDIHWAGTIVGLVPTVAGDAARRLLAAGGQAIPQLVDALGDESRFVAAHVLLTMLSGVEYQSVPWNGLEVELSSDNKVQVEPSQRLELARRWRDWQRATPPPRSLFP